jgi:hypothetical protein
VILEQFMRRDWQATLLDRHRRSIRIGSAALDVRTTLVPLAHDRPITEHRRESASRGLSRWRGQAARGLWVKSYDRFVLSPWRASAYQDVEAIRVFKLCRYDIKSHGVEGATTTCEILPLTAGRYPPERLTAPPADNG